MKINIDGIDVETERDDFSENQVLYKELRLKINAVITEFSQQYPEVFLRDIIHSVLKDFLKEIEGGIR